MCKRLRELALGSVYVAFICWGQYQAVAGDNCVSPLRLHISLTGLAEEWPPFDGAGLRGDRVLLHLLTQVGEFGGRLAGAVLLS